MKTFLNQFSRQFIGSVAPVRLVYMAARTPEDALKEMAEKAAPTPPAGGTGTPKKNKVEMHIDNVRDKKANILSRGFWGTVNGAMNLKRKISGDITEDNNQALSGMIKSNINKAAAAELADGKDPFQDVEDKATKKLIALGKKGNRKLALARARSTVLTTALAEVTSALSSLNAKKASYGSAIESLKAGKTLDTKVKDLEQRKEILEGLEQENDQAISELRSTVNFDDVQKYDSLIRGVVHGSGDERASTLLDDALRENCVGNSEKLHTILGELRKNKNISNEDFIAALEASKKLGARFGKVAKTARLYYSNEVWTKHYLDYPQFGTTPAIPLAPDALAASFVNTLNGNPEDFFKGQLVTINSTRGKIDAMIVKRDPSSDSLILVDRKRKNLFLSITLDNPTKPELVIYDSSTKRSESGPLKVPCMVQPDSKGALVRRPEYKDRTRVYLDI